MRGFFVTGTDTGVGKTVVSAALAAARELSAVGQSDPPDHGLATACLLEHDLLSTPLIVDDCLIRPPGDDVSGGLGVLLGTLGLGAVVYRSVGERRGELALLRAVGFPRRVLGVLVLCETAVLLLLGLLAGGGAAVLAVVPAAAAAGGEFSWRGLLFTLAGILGAGLLAAVVALRSALRVPLVPALRSE